MKIFTKARVSNVVAGTVIIYSIFAITQLTLDAISMTALGTLSGFAAKHLFDSAMQADN